MSHVLHLAVDGHEDAQRQKHDHPATYQEQHRFDERRENMQPGPPSIAQKARNALQIIVELSGGFTLPNCRVNHFGKERAEDNRSAFEAAGGAASSR